MAHLFHHAHPIVITESVTRNGDVTLWERTARLDRVEIAFIWIFFFFYKKRIDRRKLVKEKMMMMMMMITIMTTMIMVMKKRTLHDDAGDNDDDACDNDDGDDDADDDECSAAPCSHFCHNAPGSFACSCPIGFSLTGDARTCQGENTHPPPPHLSLHPPPTHTQTVPLASI